MAYPMMRRGDGIDHQVGRPVFQKFSTTIETAWTEAGHLVVGGYMAIFDRATDCLRDHVGLSRQYGIDNNCGMYVVEAHISYSRELAAGDAIEVGTLIVNVDPKKVHLYHEMRKLPERITASAIEMIVVHVDRQSGRSFPFPPSAFDLLREVAAQHALEPLPPLIGRRLSLDKNGAQT